MSQEEKIILKFDHHLVYSCENFRETLSDESRYNEEIAETAAFPTDYELCLFSKIVYEDEPLIPEELVKKNWTLLTIAKNKSISNGYFGAAFWNPKTFQVVLANRGTDWKKNVGSLGADLKLILHSFQSTQAQSAASFANVIREAIDELNRKRQPQIRLSVTGHSLGGWLAQYTAFTIKFLILNSDGRVFEKNENYCAALHPCAVVFDSPGCRDTLTKLLRSYVPRYSRRKFGSLDALHIVVYINRINAINSVNEHVGSIYMLDVEVHSINNVVAFFRSQGRHLRRVRVLDFKHGKLVAFGRLFKMACSLSSLPSSVQLQQVEQDEESLSIFTEQELQVVKCLTKDMADKYESIRNFNRLREIPEFQLDLEYCSLKGNDLKRTVARIKNQKLTKQILDEILLKNDVVDQINFELFKKDSQLNESTLYNFGDYVLRDIYAVENLVKGNDRFLGIRVPDDSISFDDDLAVSAIKNYIVKNSLLTGNCYACLHLEQLRKIITIADALFKRNLVELLFLNCVGTLESDLLEIVTFIEKTNCKIVAISNQFEWLEGSFPIINSVQLTVGHLSPDSRTRLVQTCLVQISGKSYCLESIYDSSQIIDTLPLEPFLSVTHDSLSEMEHVTANNTCKRAFFYDLYQKVDVNVAKNVRSYIIRTDTTVNYDLKDVANQEEFEKECLHHSETVNYLFSDENLTEDEKGTWLHLLNIFDIKFYIPRSIFHGRSFKWSVFNNDSIESPQVYLFFGDINTFNGKVGLVSEDIRDRYRHVDSPQDAFLIFDQHEGNVHVFEISERDLRWIRSKGNVTYLRKHLKSDEFQIGVDESQIAATAADQNVTILSGEPGSGKSSLVDQLLLSAQDSCWIFALRLPQCDFDLLGDDFDQIANFIVSNNCVKRSALQRVVLAKCLEKGSRLRILLMLDAFDEITEKTARVKIVQLINVLSGRHNVTVLVTTLPHASAQLENGVSVLTSRFAPIDESRRASYLATFLQHQANVLAIEQDTSNNFLAMAHDVLSQARNSLGHTIDTFLGIPMHTRLIAETVGFKLLQSQCITFDDVLGLYKRYILNRLNIYLKRFCTTDYDTKKDFLKESIMRRLSEIGIAAMASLVEGGQMDRDEFGACAELYKVGLVYPTVSPTIIEWECPESRFAHKSIGDYFASFWLKTWMETSSRFNCCTFDVQLLLVRDLFLNKGCKLARLFLNFSLEADRISLNTFERCRAKLLSLSPEDCVDQKGRNVFHICVKENLTCLLELFWLKILNSDVTPVALLSHKTDTLETALWYAADRIDLQDDPECAKNVVDILLDFLQDMSAEEIKRVLLATVFNFPRDEKVARILLCRSKKTHVKIFEQLMKIEECVPLVDQYLDMCKRDNVETILNLLTNLRNEPLIVEYLLMSRDQLLYTGLHLTTSTGVVKKIATTRNINLRDHRGLTPLARAIKDDKQFSLIEMMIDKGARDSVDRMGNTTLMHAAKKGKMPIVRLLFNTEIATVQDINVKNLAGNTALMLAAKHNHDHVLHALMDRGANAAMQDREHNTALHMAVKGKALDSAKVLVKRAKTILNMQNKRGETAFFYALRLGRIDEAQMLMDNGAIVHLGNGTILPVDLCRVGKKYAGILKKLNESSMPPTSN